MSASEVGERQENSDEKLQGRPRSSNSAKKYIKITEKIGEKITNDECVQCLKQLMES